MDCELRLYVDRVPPGRQADARQAAAVRAMYVVDGAIRLRAGGCAASLTSNSAWVGTSEVEIGGGHAAATVLRWELVGRGSPPPIAACWIESRLSLGAVVSLVPAVDHLLRCDRVDFPP